MTAFFLILRFLIAMLPGIAGTVLYYEGLPVISKVPYIEYVPLVGTLAVGEKHRYAKEQVRIETAKMVSAFEYEVVAQQLAVERRRADQAAQITEEYRKRTEAAVRATAQAQDKLEKAIAEDSGTDSPVWDARDIEWLCEHGSKAPQCSR